MPRNYTAYISADKLPTPLYSFKIQRVFMNVFSSNLFVSNIYDKKHKALIWCPAYCNSLPEVVLKEILRAADHPISCSKCEGAAQFQLRLLDLNLGYFLALKRMSRTSSIVASDFELSPHIGNMTELEAFKSFYSWDLYCNH